jgi:chromosome segregation ATPase
MSPSKRRRTNNTTRLTKAIALNDRLAEIHDAIAKLKRSRAAVRRDEFVELKTSLQQLQENTDKLLKHTKDLATQFTRISQIQAELDVIKAALKKAKWLD